jgi:protein-tyrosine-phosphatase
VTDEAIQPTTWKDVVRKFIPRFLLQQRGIIRRLGPGAGRIYAGLRMRDVIGMRRENQRQVPSTARSFVFVCFGNIMRSAMAEFLMKKALSQAPQTAAHGVRIVSAGLHANPGREAHPWMQEAADGLAISLTSHRAKLLTREMVDQADAIFAMDFQNKAELLTLYSDAVEKIYMLSTYAEGPWKDREIPDPYLVDLEGTRYCARQLEICVHNLLAGTVLAGSNGEMAEKAYEDRLART